jgi:hypothetical protein
MFIPNDSTQKDRLTVANERRESVHLIQAGANEQGGS